MSITELIHKNFRATYILYICINALFVAKYSQRVIIDHWQWIVLAVVIVHTLMLWWLLPYFQKSNRYIPLLMLVGILSFIGMICVQYWVDPNEVRVDRWSALHNPIANLLHGIYPYTAKTHLGGYASPFPIWQILHIPFYLMGNVGLSFFAALLFFLFAIYRTSNTHQAFCAMMMIAVSPAVWYEVAVRSDLITNILFTCAICILVLPYLTTNWMEKYTVPIAVVIALLSCTRIITLLPTALLLFPFWLHMKHSKKLLLLFVFAITFIVTFLPFVLWDYRNFFYFEYSPWVLQTRQGNGIGFLLYIPLGILLAIQWKTTFAYYRNTAIMLVLFIGIAMLLNMFTSGNYDLFSSSYDITYYSTALPFCIASMINHKENSVRRE